MAYAPWSKDEASRLLSQTCVQPGPVLISLQAIQSFFGYVPDSAIGLIAQACNVTRAEVHGVLTFYTDLRTSPPPSDLVRLCAAEACQAVGSRELEQELKNAGIEYEEVFCFGNCALGPAVNINGKLMGRASVDSVMKELNE